MSVAFTAHNIRLDDGTYTKPELGYAMDAHPWFQSARRVLETVFPGDKSKARIADIGCLEGGYSVEFARMGFRTLGLEVRESNLEACRYVQSRTNLPNLEFVRDDAWNIAKYGPFDAIFCCGLLYHLDRPKQFLNVLAGAATKLVIVQTHFASDDIDPMFRLSPPAEHEGMSGRWFVEFGTDDEFRDREQAKWAAWDNYKSFWPRREALIQAVRDSGFDLVLEQFDGHGHDIVGTMSTGIYKTHGRGTFVGIKTRPAAAARAAA